MNTDKKLIFMAAAVFVVACGSETGSGATSGEDTGSQTSRGARGHDGGGEHRVWGDTDAQDTPVADVPDGPCVDLDGDGHGEGAGCVGDDCDDDNDNRYYGATEVCDGIDNDCNELIDDECSEDPCKIGDELECYDGPDETRGVGLCEDGLALCVEVDETTLAWGSCEDPVLPTGESCNGFDDDCDGDTDEDWDFNTDETHCGECDNACIAGCEECVGGECVTWPTPCP